MGCISIKW